MDYPASLRAELQTHYRRAAAHHAPQSTPSGFTQGRIKPVDISLNLLATSLVYNLAPHHAANVGEPVASRSQVAPDAVDAFTEDNLYPFGSLAQNYDVQGLSTFGYTYLDFLVIHKSINSAS